ncbi:hypothetical protein [Hymenobacter lucidus]|uniref:Uncharacterized protein n=1 Tax=Hymenobacter lucidus TaxID=2880930 RepID=A0ABS8ASH2_9BACT|nr:hypothetical protein [Hymenobacter lucidus]MCB2408731.1 hypothetical protein [Hymenobacter lucidus]
MNRKWILRLGLTALALLVTTDRRRPKPKPPTEPPKPEDNEKGPLRT